MHSALVPVFSSLVSILSALVPVLSAPSVRAEVPRQAQLDSGLQLVVMEDRALPLVSIELWYRVGSLDDPPNRTGICEMARDCLDAQSQATRKLQHISQRTASDTLHEACRFRALVETPRRIDATAILRGLLETRSIETTAIRDRIRSPSAPPTAPDPEEAQALAMAVFDGHPLARVPQQGADRIAAEFLAGIQDFISTWFVPGNATLIVYGDVDAIAEMERLKLAFQGLPWREPPAREPTTPPTLSSALLPPACARRPGLDLCWGLQRVSMQDDTALDVLGAYLANPVDGLLPQCRWLRWSHRDASMVALATDIPPIEDSGYAGWLMRPLRYVEACARLRAALEAIANESPDPIRFHRARAIATAAARARRARFAARAEDFGWAQILYGDGTLAELQFEAASRLRTVEMQGTAHWLAQRPIAVRERRACRPDRRTIPKTPIEDDMLADSPAAVARLLARIGPPPEGGIEGTSFELRADLRVSIAEFSSMESAVLLRIASPDAGPAKADDAESSGPDRSALSLLRRLQDPASASRVLDYATYTGILLETGPEGVLAHCPPPQVEALLELILNPPHRHDPRSLFSPREIIIVGPQAASEVQILVRRSAGA